MTGQLIETVGSFLTRRCGYTELKAAYAAATKPIHRLFVLGGNDAEMEVVKSLLSQAGQQFVQPKKEWGDHKYSIAEIGVELTDRLAPYFYGTVEHWLTAVGIDEIVLVECGLQDSQFDSCHVLKTAVVFVDHHGNLSDRPASVRQVLDILEADGFEVSNELRRWVELIAANDSGYIPAMLTIGATSEEINRVRLMDRSAQGITVEHEAEAERAIAAKEVSGRLTVIRMAHSKTASVADRMFGGYDQLLILSANGETNFYGDGALCADLKTRFDGWNGGSGLGRAGANAYWGGYPTQEDVLIFIEQHLK